MVALLYFSGEATILPVYEDPFSPLTARRYIVDYQIRQSVSMQSLEWRGSGGETLEVEIKTVATASLALMRLGSFRVGPPRHLIRAHLSILPRTYLRSRTLLSSTQNMGFNCGQPLGRVQRPVRDSTCMSQSRYDGSPVRVVQSCLLHKGRLSIFIALDCRHLNMVPSGYVDLVDFL